MRGCYARELAGLALSLSLPLNAVSPRFLQPRAPLLYAPADKGGDGHGDGGGRGGREVCACVWKKRGGRVWSAKGGAGFLCAQSYALFVASRRLNPSMPPASDAQERDERGRN